MLTTTRISQAGQRRYTVTVPEPVPHSRLLAVELEGKRCILELPMACGPGQTLACAPALTAALTADAGGEGEGEGRTPELPSLELSVVPFGTALGTAPFDATAEEFDVPLPAEVMAGQVLYAHTPSGELVSFAVPEPIPPSRSLRVCLRAAARRRRQARSAAPSAAAAAATVRLEATQPTAAFWGRSAHDVRAAATFVGLGLGLGTGNGTGAGGLGLGLGLGTGTGTGTGLGHGTGLGTGLVPFVGGGAGRRASGRRAGGAAAAVWGGD